MEGRGEKTRTKITGYWIPVLHAHIPFVKHPGYDFFLEENWLFEALSESYIPLIKKLKEMDDEKIEFRLTISLSPSLMEMLADGYLMDKFTDFLEKRIELSKKEQKRLRKDRIFYEIACFYRQYYEEIRSFFENELGGDIIGEFNRFFKKNRMEIITSTATHGLLPLLETNPESVKAQIEIGIKTFVKYFKKRPAGLWIPECAYYSGLDRILREYDIEYTFLDSHSIMNRQSPPRYGVYAPVYTENGVAVFGRDPFSSKLVWSAQEGYPGDHEYREFYRDIGFEREIDYIRPYINPDGARTFTGLKYYRITGNTERKLPYRRERAMMKVHEHALDFYSGLKGEIRRLSDMMERPPSLVSLYDAELFGHWWFEGVEFLTKVLRMMHDGAIIKTITPSEYLNLYPENQVISPLPGSWGENGYYETWLNPETDWIYREIHYMAQTMARLVKRHRRIRNNLKKRILNQMLRELLLVQSSDWAFLISTDSARNYSIARLKEHIDNFYFLASLIDGKVSDTERLEEIEGKNSIFSDIDFRVFSE